MEIVFGLREVGIRINRKVERTEKEAIRIGVEVERQSLHEVIRGRRPVIGIDASRVLKTVG